MTLYNNAVDLTSIIVYMHNAYIRGAYITEDNNASSM